MMSDFWLKCGQFRYYGMRLWIIFESCLIVFKISLILGLFLAASSLRCGTGSVVATCGLPQGMWDPRSPTREQTCIPRIGRQILNPWTTREVPASTKEVGPVGRGYTDSFLPCGNRSPGSPLSFSDTWSGEGSSLLMSREVQFWLPSRPPGITPWLGGAGLPPQTL